jgi:hypothetical protein
MEVLAATAAPDGARRARCPAASSLGPRSVHRFVPAWRLPSFDIGYQGYHGCQECGWLMLRTLPPWPEILTHHISVGWPCGRLVRTHGA